MKHWRFAAPCAGLMGLLVTTTAQAEVVERHHGPEDDYFVFSDDLVDSDVFDSTAPRLVVRPGGTRVLLLRPRTSFVVEMLKTVEAF